MSLSHLHFPFLSSFQAVFSHFTYQFQFPLPPLLPLSTPSPQTPPPSSPHTLPREYDNPLSPFSTTHVHMEMKLATGEQETYHLPPPPTHPPHKILILPSLGASCQSNVRNLHPFHLHCELLTNSRHRGQHFTAFLPILSLSQSFYLVFQDVH